MNVVSRLIAVLAVVVVGALVYKRTGPHDQAGAAFGVLLVVAAAGVVAIALFARNQTPRAPAEPVPSGELRRRDRVEGCATSIFIALVLLFTMLGMLLFILCGPPR
jgi:hypothetical protein